MCGIAGIYNFRASSMAVERHELSRMGDYQVLRGPDACGEWYSTAHALGFSHRRLSIIDLDSSSDQPMVDVINDLVIIFNGEIYNYRELRQELIDEGCKFQTQSDTEVSLQVYAHWGEPALDQLLGMKVFEIWDEKSKASSSLKTHIALNAFDSSR